MSVRGGGVTMTVSATTLERPFASVTRSRTTWLPGVENEVLITGGPAWNVPLPVVSHEKDVIGLETSVELDASDTGSPVCGAVGNHANAATGGDGTFGVTAGASSGAGAETVNVATRLVTVFTVFVNIARYSGRSQREWYSRRSDVSAVAPGTEVHAAPPFVDSCHCKVGVGVPEAAAVNVAVSPATTLSLTGLITITGATSTVNLAGALATGGPAAFVNTARYS